MVDPLSIAASIAGLISLADVVFDRLIKYSKSAKNANEEIRALANEVNLLIGALSSLERLAKGFRDEPFDRAFRMDHIDACQTLLQSLREKVPKPDANDLKNRLTWPFKSSFVKEKLEELTRHQQHITLALTADSMNTLLRVISAQKDSQDTASKTLSHARQTHEIVCRIHQDAEKRKVLESFLRCNPQSNYEMSLGLRHPRTALWLLRMPDFQTWVSMPGSKVWFSGIPGAGKTVLAGSIIEAALERSTEKIATAFFFCDYKDAKTHDLVNILGALAYQLAIQKDEAYDILEGYYEELHPSRGLPRNSTASQLADLLGKMATLFDHVLVVVDALDECGNSTVEVVRCLVEISEKISHMSLALLSRDELHIRCKLDGYFKTVEIAAKKDDIILYVTCEIEERIRGRRLHIEDPELKEEILEGLIDGAKGM